MATTFKVATLVIKTLVKPVANQLKKNAVHEGWFRDSCHWAGQVSNAVLTHVQLRSMGHKVKKIKPMPTDDAVKAGADLFAEGMVLSTGMIAIGAEVIRKTRSDAAAAEKKQMDDILLKEKKELKLMEKERSLREQLTRLETRMIEVENAKFATLYDKFLHEQQKHLLVTENLLKRIHHLEQELKISTPYPLLPSHRPASHPSNLQQASQSAPVVVEGQEQQGPGMYQRMREQTNKLFSYSSFFQSESVSPSPAQVPQDVSVTQQLMLAEEDMLHTLLDTKLPECFLNQAQPESDPKYLSGGLSHCAAELLIEAETLPEEETLDSIESKSVSDQQVKLDSEIAVVIPILPPKATSLLLVTPSHPTQPSQQSTQTGIPLDPFPAIKPRENHEPLLADLPPPPHVPSSKAHLSVKL